MFGLIGGALGAIGGLFGGLSANAKIKEQQAAIERSQQRNEDWYNRRYNEDPTQRASAQFLLKKVEEQMRKRSKETAGRAAMTGTTEAAVAAEKEANAHAITDAVGQIYANNEARKDKIEENYENRKNSLQDKYDELGAQTLNGFDFFSNILGGAAKGAGMG